jgi:hypothetical protein
MANFRDVLFKKNTQTPTIVRNNNFIVKRHGLKHLDRLVVMFIEPGQPTRTYSGPY